MITQVVGIGTCEIVNFLSVCCTRGGGEEKEEMENMKVLHVGLSLSWTDSLYLYLYCTHILSGCVTFYYGNCEIEILVEISPYNQKNLKPETP